jgi:cytochrome oxidase Cu insertion factor (SCO1/SenC/PrrC family)
MHTPRLPRAHSLLLLCLVSSLAAQTAPRRAAPQPATQQLPATDLERVKVGSLAPDFTLPDERSKPVTLSDYRGRKSVVLVFYRGYW